VTDSAEALAECGSASAATTASPMPILTVSPLSPRPFLVDLVPLGQKSTRNDHQCK
jgi:hypothetical protein